MGSSCTKTADALLRSETGLIKSVISIQDAMGQMWETLHLMHVMLKDLIEDNHTVLLAIQTHGLKIGAEFSDSETTDPDERDPRTLDEGVCIDVRTDELPGQGHEDNNQQCGELQQRGETGCSEGQPDVCVSKEQNTPVTE